MVAKAISDGLLSDLPSRQIGPNSIPEEVAKWAQDGDTLTPKYVCNGDSVYHVIKGMMTIPESHVLIPCSFKTHSHPNIVMHFLILVSSKATLFFMLKTLLDSISSAILSKMQRISAFPHFKTTFLTMLVQVPRTKTSMKLETSVAF